MYLVIFSIRISFRFRIWHASLPSKPRGGGPFPVPSVPRGSWVRRVPKAYKVMVFYAFINWKNSMYLSVYLPIYLSMFLSIYLFLDLSMHLFTKLPTLCSCNCNYLCICVCLSIPTFTCTFLVPVLLFAPCNFFSVLVPILSVTSNFFVPNTSLLPLFCSI